MREEPLRRTCEAVIAHLTLPQPFSAQAFCATVAAARGRPVHLRTHAFTDGGISGLCISTEQADHLFYEAHTTALHQEHIVLHELGHLVLGHAATSPMAEGRLLLPDIDVTRVLRTLGRSAHSDAQERAAELFAEMVLDQAHRARRQSGAPESVEVLTRMRDTLGA